MARYRIVKITKFNDEVKYAIQKKGLFGWKQAYYHICYSTYKAIENSMNEALETLTSRFNVVKAKEVVWDSKTNK